MDASPLAGWENFYVIIGSSAGGLTGLTFVVIALIRDAARVQPTGLHAFVTPTIVHFGAALALAAYLSMPHQSVPTLRAGVGLVGLGGLSYGGPVAARLPASAARAGKCLAHGGSLAPPAGRCSRPAPTIGSARRDRRQPFQSQQPLRAAAPGRSGSVRLKLGQRFAVGMLVWAAACGAA